MSDLAKRLRIKAGMIEMGERIAWGSDSALMREAADALEVAAPAVQGEPEIEPYDVGFLNDFGGGNVGWWHDYIRAELDRAYEFYLIQLADAPQPTPQPAEKQENVPAGWRSRFLKLMGEMQSELDEANDDPIPSGLWSLWRELLDTTPQPAEQQPAPAVQGVPVAIVCDFSDGNGPQPTFVEAEVGGKSVSFEWRDRPDGLKELLVPQSVTPDVKALVEALERIAAKAEAIDEGGDGCDDETARSVAADLRALIAAHRKGGEA